MAKMKVVMKLHVKDEKERAKSMKLSVGYAGVTSATLGEKDKNELTVVGDGIDAYGVVELLRGGKPIKILKCLGSSIRAGGVGHVDLIKVEEIKEKKDEKKDEKKEDGKEKEKAKEDAKPAPPPCHCLHGYPQYQVVEVWDQAPKSWYF